MILDATRKAQRFIAIEPRYKKRRKRSKIERERESACNNNCNKWNIYEYTSATKASKSGNADDCLGFFWQHRSVSSQASTLKLVFLVVCSNLSHSLSLFILLSGSFSLPTSLSLSLPVLGESIAPPSYY